MDFFFADDARREKPTRPGMGSLTAVGGILVPDNSVKTLEHSLNNLCDKYHFPSNEVFKYSPGQDLWMHDNLTGDNRKNFFISSLELAKKFEAIALVVIEDTQYRKADTNSPDYEIDALRLILERVHHCLVSKQCTGVVVVAQPSGDRKSEQQLLAKCFETLQVGTSYVKPDSIALNVFSSPTKYSRLLQLADIVVSSSTAIVSGEDTYSPPIFTAVEPLLDLHGDRIGGYGLKIHPDNIYVNLYHWIVKDKKFQKNNTIVKLPHIHAHYHLGPITL
jgi:hypothetical protein